MLTECPESPGFGIVEGRSIVGPVNNRQINSEDLRPMT
jgi:hypothetical protein